jgi:WD40 repeat protein
MATMVTRLAVTEDVFGLDLSPDKAWLALGLWDGTCLVFRTERLLDGGGIGESESSTVLSSDGDLVEGGGLLCDQQLRLGEKDTSHYIGCVAFSSDSRHLCIGGRDGNAEMYALADGGAEPKWVQTHTLEKLESSFIRAGCADHRAFTGSQSGSIAVWSFETGTLLKRLEENDCREENTLRLSPDGNYLAAAADGGLFLWDVKGEDVSREEYSQVGAVRGDDSWDAVFMPDSDSLFCSRRKIEQRSVPDISVVLRTFSEGSGTLCLCFALNPSGSLLAVGTDSEDTWIFETSDATVVHEKLQENVLRAVFLDDGRVFLGSRMQSGAAILEVMPSFTKSAGKK